jgi:hypothetical protein
MWLGVEYLMWFLKESPISVPLVTNGVLDNNVPGAAGEAGTRVLIGNQTVNDNAFSGLRWRFGADLGGSGIGIEAVGFVLDQQRTSFAIPSAMSSPSVLGLPFFSVDQNAEGIALLRFPQTVDGSTSFSLRTNLSGAEVNLGYSVNAGIVDWVYAGYRYLNLTEALTLNSRFSPLDPAAAFFRGAPFPGGVGEISDTFRTGNNFNGGQFGFAKRFVYGPMSLDFRTALAIGDTRARVTIAGESRVGTQNADGSVTPTATARGGLFALPSNIGTTVTHQLSVIPEVGVTLNCQVFDGILAYVGYSYLYWDNVARPGEQIDRSIERSQIPFSRTFTGAPAGLPSVTLRRSDLSIHGLNAGFALQF